MASPYEKRTREAVRAVYAAYDRLSAPSFTTHQLREALVGVTSTFRRWCAIAQDDPVPGLVEIHTAIRRCDVAEEDDFVPFAYSEETVRGVAPLYMLTSWGEQLVSSWQGLYAHVEPLFWSEVDWGVYTLDYLSISISEMPCPELQLWQEFVELGDELDEVSGHGRHLQSVPFDCECGDSHRRILRLAFNGETSLIESFNEAGDRIIRRQSLPAAGMGVVYDLCAEEWELPAQSEPVWNAFYDELCRLVGPPGEQFRPYRVTTRSLLS